MIHFPHTKCLFCLLLTYSKSNTYKSFKQKGFAYNDIDLGTSLIFVEFQIQTVEESCSEIVFYQDVQCLEASGLSSKSGILYKDILDNSAEWRYYGADDKNHPYVKIFVINAIKVRSSSKYIIYITSFSTKFNGLFHIVLNFWKF